MSRIIGRVVLGVSGSPENLHALRHAVELARHYEATLIAVNAQPPRRVRGSWPPQRGSRGGPVWQQAASFVVRGAFEDALGGLPVDVECVLLAAPGDPGPRGDRRPRQRRARTRLGAATRNASDTL